MCGILCTTCPLDPHPSCCTCPDAVLSSCRAALCPQDPSVHGKPSAPAQQQHQPSALASAPSTASQISAAARSSLEAQHNSRSSLEGPGLSDPALRRKTLSGVKLLVQPGELLAVVGEVGAGKSSLLAALLGELMPVKGPDGIVHGEGAAGGAGFSETKRFPLGFCFVVGG